MCKRNSPDKNKASTGFVRETPRINMKPARNVSEKLTRLIKEKKKKASMGCVRETPHIEMKQSWDV